MRWTLCFTGLLVLGGVLVAVVGGLWFRGALQDSLPRLEGELALEGLAAPVVVERDALGIPTIRGRNRLDVARATGFVHAQDRFFQMDLMRRSAAGELSELFGPAALEWDRHIRVHRFRDVARRAILENAGGYGPLLDAYASGVNQGLEDLESPPFEYLVLRVDPEPWRTEDVVLVSLRMFITLQDEDGSKESSLGVMSDVLPPALFELLATKGTELDAPLLGPAMSTPVLPGPDVIDLRRAAPPPEEAEVARVPPPGEAAVGSNNWAVGGALTDHGGAMVANDMHLGLGVPGVWYRASLVWPRDDEGNLHRVTGVTLPGAPEIVAGSNGSIAWGFTNSYGDWSDLVVLESDPGDPASYRTPDGSRRVERHDEIISVKGGDDVTVEVEWTLWGPVIDEDAHGRRRAMRWVAHEPGGLDVRMAGLEQATTVEQAIRSANGSGVPAQNIVVADSSGNIGWSIFGKIPRRVGFDGRLPGSWADGTRRWDGWLAPHEYPRVVNPPGARIWTANNRVVDGAMLRVLGDGGYALGARAAQIRDGLMELDRADEAALLALQLDDRAVLLDRWRDLLLEILTPEATTGNPGRAEFRRVVEDDWSGRASVDSAGYRLVRAFRQMLSSGIYESLTAPCREADPRFRAPGFQREGPVWKMLTERPANLLEARFDSWDERLLAAVTRPSTTTRGSTTACPFRGAPGDAATRPGSGIRCRAPCPSSAAGWTCPPSRFPGTA